MSLYRKKPVEVQAWQWNGAYSDVPSWVIMSDPSITLRTDSTLAVPTLEGVITANVGDWLIQGVKGEIYPCKPDIFEATYEPVEPDD